MYILVYKQPACQKKATPKGRSDHESPKCWLRRFKSTWQWLDVQAPVNSLTIESHSAPLPEVCVTGAFS